jgi:carbon-monoxide dehydrogenase catalytic subunit
MLPVMGSALVAKVLTQTVKDLTGGYFIVEPDPDKAADMLLQALNDRRKGLGLV